MRWRRWVRRLSRGGWICRLVVVVMVMVVERVGWWRRCCRWRGWRRVGEDRGREARSIVALRFIGGLVVGNRISGMTCRHCVRVCIVFVKCVCVCIWSCSIIVNVSTCMHKRLWKWAIYSLFECNLLVKSTVCVCVCAI